MIGRLKSLEETCLSAFSPPVMVGQPSTLIAPVVFASPHSGNLYPQAFIGRSDLDPLTLRRNEDAFIDKLFASVSRCGAPLLTARFPRSFLDVNRARDELPQKWLARGKRASSRAEIGLGVIPTMISESRAIYRRPLRASVVKRRIAALYDPYHSALKQLIETSKAEFGQTLLIDCHSMPGFAPSGQRRADIILGDRYGTSCHPETISRIERLFTDKGYAVTRNYPYAGSFVTSHYGQPENNVEALQIEINRDLYLDAASLTPSQGYKALENDLEEIISDIIMSARPARLMAAE